MAWRPRWTFLLGTLACWVTSSWAGEVDLKQKIFEERLLAGQPNSVVLAQELGADAVPSLLRLSSHPEEKVRLAVVDCVSLLHDDRLLPLVIELVADPCLSVSVEAMRALRNYQTELTVEPVVQIYRRIPGPSVRCQVAFILGQIKGARLDELTPLDSWETEPEARFGILVAQASLGSPRAQRQFQEVLTQSKDRALLDALNFVERMNQNWAWRSLQPLLENTSPLVYIGVCEQPSGSALTDGPEYLRACDVVVNLVGAHRSDGFPILLNPALQYPQAERQQVKDFLKRLP